MKLEKSTRVNGIVFHDNTSDQVISQFDLNEPFGNFLEKANKPKFNFRGKISKAKNLDKMLELDYSKDKEGSANTFWNYIIWEHKSDRFTASFIELVEK